MKIKDFKYTKKNGEESEYSLLTLREDKEYLAGIDLNKLVEEEKDQVIQIQKDYEERLKPFMKAYRQFIIENIIEEE